MRLRPPDADARSRRPDRAKNSATGSLDEPDVHAHRTFSLPQCRTSVGIGASPDTDQRPFLIDIPAFTIVWSSAGATPFSPDARAQESERAVPNPKMPRLNN